MNINSSIPNSNVSILMSVYNTDFLLVKRAIDSVVSQSFKDFELIIMDDGSDEVLSIKLLGYCDVQHANISYVKHKNVGQSISINRAVKLSVGEYIAIIDSDDEYKYNHIELCLKEMETADLISSFTETIINTEMDYYVPDKDNNQKSIHVDDCILFATLFGKREVFEKNNFKNMYAADADFYELSKEYFNVKKVNLKTYIYYRNIDNSTSALLKKIQSSN